MAGIVRPEGPGGILGTAPSSHVSLFSLRVWQVEVGYLEEAGMCATLLRSPPPPPPQFPAREGGEEQQAWALEKGLQATPPGLWGWS